MAIAIEETSKTGNGDASNSKSSTKSQPSILQGPLHEGDCAMTIYTSFLKAQSDTITEYLSLLYRHEDLRSDRRPIPTSGDRLGSTERRPAESDCQLPEIRRHLDLLPE
jgi:hypothetical protein